MSEIRQIAMKFRVTKHEAEMAISLHGRSININLINSQLSIYDKVATEIYSTRKRLLSEMYIGSILEISNVVPLEKCPYIYFLYDDGVLTYIGKTNNLLQRIGTHQGDKEFNGISYMKVDKKIMGMVENLNIYYYQPLLNVQGKTNIEFLKVVLSECDFDSKI